MLYGILFALIVVTAGYIYINTSRKNTLKNNKVLKAMICNKKQRLIDEAKKNYR
jgi:hypothetical protein